jgi:hypothetical protein
VLDVAAPRHVVYRTPAATGDAAALMPASRRQPLVPAAPTTQVCAPANAGSRQHNDLPTITIGSGGLYQDDGTGQQPIIETPPLSTDSAGCVRVG